MKFSIRRIAPDREAVWIVALLSLALLLAAPAALIAGPFGGGGKDHGSGQSGGGHGSVQSSGDHGMSGGDTHQQFGGGGGHSQGGAKDLYNQGKQACSGGPLGGVGCGIMNVLTGGKTADKVNDYKDQHGGGLLFGGDGHHGGGHHGGSNQPQPNFPGVDMGVNDGNHHGDSHDGDHHGDSHTQSSGLDYTSWGQTQNVTQGENKGKNEKESDDDGKVAETQSVDPAATKTPAAKKQDPNKKANEIAAPGIDGSHSVDEMERERELMRLRGLKKNFHMKKVEGEASSEVGGTSLPIPAPNKADTPDSGPAYHEGMVQVPGMGNPGASGSQQFSVAEGYLRDASEKNMMSDFQGSLRSAKEVIARDKSNWKAHNFMAVAYNRLADGKGLSREQRMANYQQAEWSALEALRCKLDYAPAYESLAWAQLKLGKYKDAVASASNAIKYNPKSAIGYAVRAYANEMLGRRDDMLADIEAAARLNPVLFDEALRKAKRGERIYDPNEDSWQLLQSVAKGRMGALPWPVAAGLLAGLAALALCGALAWKKFSPQLRPKSERMKAELSSAVLQKDAAAEEAAGRLAGKYQLARIIGKGGMGEVWEAKDISLDRIVAVKKMVIAGNFEAKAREMYLKEARTLAALHHPNIVDIYEVIDLPSGLYLVFELLAGKTVQQILAESKRIRLAQAKEILKPVCDALEFAHASSVVHRDLKPSNIMVTEQGYIKVMDFGIARRIQDGGPQGPVPAGALLSINPAPGGNGGSAPAFLTSFARTQTIAGTPAYMAPEAESGLVTPTLDVYALGVCLYEMLTGELPFSQHEVARKMERAYVKASARVPGVPRQIDALIDSALDPDIATRMKTAKEFQQALEAVPVQA